MVFNDALNNISVGDSRTIVENI